MTGNKRRAKTVLDHSFVFKGGKFLETGTKHNKMSFQRRLESSVFNDSMDSYFHRNDSFLKLSAPEPFWVMAFRYVLCPFLRIFAPERELKLSNQGMK